MFARYPDTESDINLLGAARACANAKMNDDAFSFLFIIVRRHSGRLYKTIVKDADLSKLRSDRRWDRLLLKIEAAKKIFNAPVASELDSLEKERRQMDSRIGEIAQKFGTGSILYNRYKDSIMRKDEENAIKIKSIIHTYSWPGPDEIGATGDKSLLYLFQKLKFPDQKRYYPLISTAFKNGHIDALSYAEITDKISILDKGFQIYGTQQDKPLMNKDSLPYWRKAIGLN